MQKWAVFHLISKHSFNLSFVFSRWIADKFEKQIKLKKDFKLKISI